MDAPDNEKLFTIKSSFGSYTKTQRTIARFVLDHSEELRRLSITQLADKLHVDPSTITRFCQLQGYKGYSDFRFHMTHNLASAVSEDNDLIGVDDNTDVILEKLKLFCRKSVGEVFELLDPKEVERAAKLIYSAEHVHIYAQDGSINSAKYAQFMFMQIGVPCYAFTDRLFAVPASDTLKSGDAVLCISFSGDARIVLDAARNAKEKQASIIALTGFSGSNLAGFADVLLSYNSRVPDDLRYLHLIYVCELSIISAIHSVILNKYQQELAKQIRHSTIAAQVNRY